MVSFVIIPFYWYGGQPREMEGNIPPRESSLETALVIGLSEQTHGGTAPSLSLSRQNT